MCKHCNVRAGNRNRRGLCTLCWKVLRESGALAVLYPLKRPAPGTPPLLWHGRAGGEG